MTFDELFNGNYSDIFEEQDKKRLESSPSTKRKEIPFVILKNTAYQLILDKYLHLLELCSWKFQDDEGNNERLSNTIHCPGCKLNDFDTVAYYIATLPIEPSENEMKEFYRKVCRGELEFACRMHVISGYTAFDLASAYLNYYEDKGSKLMFKRRYEVIDMIFLDD